MALIFVAAVGVAAAQETLVAAVRAGDRQAALRLIAKRAGVNWSGPGGMTPLHWAVYHQDADLVERLVVAGAQARVVNDLGSTPMGDAAIVGHAAIIGALLKAGADPDSPNAQGQTALMAVARTGKVDVARLLLSAGATVNAVEQSDGESALMWAAAHRQPDMVKLLIEHGASVNARGAVRDWKGGNQDAPPRDDLERGGFTSLLYAAREGCAECARHLVEAGADVNLAGPDKATPLALAVTNMRFELAEYLIAAGADVNKRDLYGRAPLNSVMDVEAEFGAVKAIELLLKAGADVNARATNGQTALHAAAQKGWNRAIRLLVQKGASLTAADGRRLTPLDYAKGLPGGRGAAPEVKRDTVALLEQLAK